MDKKTALQMIGREIEVDVNRVAPLPRQPRRYFDQGALDKLGKSMQRKTQLLAVLVTPLIDNPEFDFQLVDGERRLRSARLKHLPKITVKVLPEMDEFAAFETAVTANFNREDHTPLEFMLVCARLKEQRSEGEIAEIVGKSESHVRNYLQMMRVRPEILQRMEPTTPEALRLPVAAVMQLSRITSHDLQTTALSQIERTGVSVRIAKNVVNRIVDLHGNARQKAQKQRQRTYDDIRSCALQLERLVLMLDGILGSAINERLSGSGKTFVELRERLVTHSRRIHEQSQQLVERLQENLGT